MNKKTRVRRLKKSALTISERVLVGEFVSTKTLVMLEAVRHLLPKKSKEHALEIVIDIGAVVMLGSVATLDGYYAGASQSTMKRVREATVAAKRVLDEYKGVKRRRPKK